MKSNQKVVQQQKSKKQDLLDASDDLEQISRKWKNYSKKQDDNESVCSSSLQDSESDLGKISEQEEEYYQQQQLSVKDEINLCDSGYSGQTQQDSVQGCQKKNTLQCDFKKKREHMPQIIDQDTEQYKLKLDHLIGVFKNEAIQEFMCMKKSMLEDQRDKIKEETERYLKMYEEKAGELLQTKGYLSEKIKECEVREKREEKWSLVCCESKRRFWNLKNLGRYWEGLKRFRVLQENKKKQKKFLCRIYEKNLMRRIKMAWNKSFGERKAEQEKRQMEQKNLEETEEITQRFSKEISTLEKRLQETTQALALANQEKENMSENLKKAFMRGVCALNFEAMNVLQGAEKKIPPEESANTMVNNFNKTVNSMGNTLMATKQSKNFHSIEEEEKIQEKSKEEQNQEKYQEDDFEENERKVASQNKKSVVYFSEPKIESKDHKWREAPVVGVPKENPYNKENNFSTGNHNTLPNFTGKINKEENQEPEEEGRVVRIQNNNNIINFSQKNNLNDKKEISQKQPPVPAKQPSKPLNQGIIKNSTTNLSANKTKNK